MTSQSLSFGPILALALTILPLLLDATACSAAPALETQRRSQGEGAVPARSARAWKLEGRLSVMPLVAPAPGARVPQISLRATATAETARDFADSAALIEQPTHRAGQELRIGAGKAQPTERMRVDLIVPADLAARRRPGDRFAVFIQKIEGGPDEIHDTFEYEELADTGGKATFTLEPYHFTDLRTQDGSWEAVLVPALVGVVPAAPRPGTRP